MQHPIYEYGIAEKIFSDLGSQNVAGSKVMRNLLKSSAFHDFFKQHNMEVPSFDHYFKGKHELGSLVESCVKISKKLFNGAIKNRVLQIRDFELIICETAHLANKRSVAVKEALRDVKKDQIPAAITQELLLKGYDTPSINLFPEWDDDNHVEWRERSDNLKTSQRSNKKLDRCRDELKRIYHEEFLGNLISQAVNSPNLYRKVPHASIRKGDIVLVKEDFLKANRDPMGRILTTTINDLNEARPGRSLHVVAGDTCTAGVRKASHFPVLFGGRGQSAALGQSPPFRNTGPRATPFFRFFG